MSENDKKRKAEESILEKIYKKIKKLEDCYYSLKKSTSKPPDNGAGCSTKEDKAQDASTLIDVLEVIGSDSPNSQLEKQCGSCSEHESSDPEIVESSIDEEALLILGDDPASNKPKAFQIHADLASRWKAWIVSGLDKEVRVELLKGYSREGNCPLEAPILNAELISSLNEAAVKRDKHFVASQCLIGSAMSALGSAITLLLNDKKEGVDRNELLKLMCDAGRLMADLHHKESVARKSYILPGLDKRAKSILGKIETDKYLFGEDLSEKLKSAKAVEKAGLDLKLQPLKSTPPKAPFKKSNSVNWKNPPARFQRTNQAGSNHQGPSTYKPRGGRAQQENRLPEQTQFRDEKSKGKK